MKSVWIAIVGLSLAVVLGACGGEVVAEDDPGANAALSSTGCHWKCGHCPANRLCKLACTQVGKCGAACTQTQLCIQGYTWSDSSCSCVPSAGGEPCGNGTCGANEFCCNTSCGICAPTGGVCTQQACASPL